MVNARWLVEKKGEIELSLRLDAERVAPALIDTSAARRALVMPPGRLDDPGSAANWTLAPKGAELD
jgi:hypothetical protein